MTTARFSRRRCKIAVLLWTWCACVGWKKAGSSDYGNSGVAALHGAANGYFCSTLRCPGRAEEFRLAPSLHLRFFAAAERAVPLCFMKRAARVKLRLAGLIAPAAR